MKIPIFLIVFFGVGLIASTAGADDHCLPAGHEAHHETYQNWLTGICCLNERCRQLGSDQVRDFGDGNFDVLIGTKWHRVPNSAIRKNLTSPNDCYHVCYALDGIRMGVMSIPCFAKPGGIS